MKIEKIAALVCFSLCAHAASAQTPIAPPPTTPPPAEPPATPATPAPVGPKSTIVEGTLFKSQRSTTDKRTFVWLCIYNVSGNKRSVQLDESCPSTMVFEIKR